jgi:hypothetical protein
VADNGGYQYDIAIEETEGLTPEETLEEYIMKIM